jgi:hypothetical protein
LSTWSGLTASTFSRRATITESAPNKPLEPTAGMAWARESRRSLTRRGSPARRSAPRGTPIFLPQRGGEVVTAAIIRMSALALLVSPLPVIEGCGVIFLGKKQQFAVRTTPGAVASLAGEQTTTPGAVTIRRNQPRGWAVLRAEQPGYRPACQLVGGQRKVGFIVMDAIFLLAVAPDAASLGGRRTGQAPPLRRSGACGVAHGKSEPLQSERWQGGRSSARR